MEERQVNLIDYFFVVVKWRRLLIKNFLIVSVASVVISLLLPKWYESQAVIMPPEEEISGLNISALLSKLPLSGFGLGGESNQVLSFMAILKSRNIKEKIVRKFNLIEVYDKKDMDRTLKKLEDNVEFVIGDEGQIVISVLDRKPERAAAMVNEFVHLLDSLYTRLNIQKARNDRMFIEKRFNQNKADLSKAEEALKAFQEKYGVIDIPEQTRAAISSAAELYSLIYLTEIELAVKRRYLSPTHNELRRKEAELQELKRKLAELKVGSPANGDLAKNDELFIPFEQVPDLGLQYIRLYREVQVQNKLYEYLIQLYEQARIEEAKDIPSIQVIDYGAVPIYKAKPKRAVIVIVAVLLSLIVSLIYVFAREYLDKALERQDSESEKLEWIRSQLAQDWERLKRFRRRP